MTHRKFKKLMVEAFYGELLPQEKELFDSHVRVCSECAEIHKRVAATLGVMHQRQRPEPDKAYWGGYWTRLESQIRRDAVAPRKSFWLDRLQILIRLEPKIAYAAGAAILLVAFGIAVGRFMMQPSFQQSFTSGESSSPAALKVEQVKRAEEYLDRSRTLLLGIVNFDTTGTSGRVVDLSRQRRVSRELLSEAHALQAELKGPDQARLRKLVSDLEVIMLQIANLEEQYDYPAIEIVKSGVDRSALLLKINLEQMQMDKRTPQPKTEKPNS
jgi:hypothetical protein